MIVLNTVCLFITIDKTQGGVILSVVIQWHASSVTIMHAAASTGPSWQRHSSSNPYGMGKIIGAAYLSKMKRSAKGETVFTCQDRRWQRGDQRRHAQYT